ncbi:MAG: ribose-5-phosphate isomerase RpiA [Caulobacteraceae bacterium]|jgi:ribose 5-phosphate isomerase A
MSEAQKRAAGVAAADLVEAGMTVGLGTGTTAAHFVRALAARKLDVTGVATSEATAALARSLGLRVADLDEVEEIQLTVDGADEIGPDLSLIKGGGAALLREKLVWTASKRCVVIADASKRVDRLGAFPLPIEVVVFGHTDTAQRIAAVLAEQGIAVRPRLRLGALTLKGDIPVRTDSGNLIYDAPCGAIGHPAALAAALKSVTGVVDHGLFLGLAERALIGTDAGVATILP